MRRIKFLQPFLLYFLALIFVTSCTAEFSEIEDRIKLQAEKNNADLSLAEIKKTAAYLIEWGRPDFYQEEVNVFLEADESIEYSEELILFTGSSSIRFWETLTQDMRPLTVLNRGFGGAHLVHVNHHFDQIVYPYNPKGIVIFCGTNDITALKTPEEVFEDFLTFFKKVQQQLPQTTVFFIGIKPTVARAYLKEEEQAFNQKIAQLSKENKNLIFIDVWDSMLIDNKPVADLFVEDGLHMNAEGYKIWTSLVKPTLVSAYLEDI